MGKKKGDTHINVEGSKGFIIGDKGQVNYTENTFDEKIAVLIQELNRHKIEGREGFIQALQDEEVRKDPKHWTATVGKIIAAAGGIASVVSAAMALLG